MGSVVTSLPGLYDQTTITGNKKKQLTYVQFVPGIVVSVITSIQSEHYNGSSDMIGSIRALPHITGKGFQKKSMVTEEGRYYPLLRGIQDVPVSGDPVLLCTFGGRQYYLGPLNTEGSPNFNNDMFSNNDLQSGVEKGFESKGISSPLFIKKPHARLQKTLNQLLDNPGINQDLFVSNAIHGDMIFEGRHGNSIRIGSRNTNPNIIISNGRGLNNAIETTLDGTILSISKRGTIREHFNHEPDKSRPKNSNEIEKLKNSAAIPDTNEGPYEFTLADDEIGTVYKSISKSMENYLGRGGIKEKNTSFDVNDAIYNYNKNQLFTSSGRITFNARDESMFLAAHDSIHLGCGSSMTFSTSNTILVEAAESVTTNTPMFHVNSDYVLIDGTLTEDADGNKIPSISLGDPSKGDSMHKAVIGTGLLTALVSIIEEMKNLALSTAQAIEGRKSVGASVKIMDAITKSLDEILGMEGVEDEVRQESYEYPKKLSDLILSDSVEIKK